MVLRLCRDSANGFRMSEYLRQQVDIRRRRMAELQRQLDTLAGELRAYEDALNHFPQDTAPGHSSKQALRRVIGESYWPELMEKLGTDGQPFTIDDVERELKALGKSV